MTIEEYLTNGHRSIGKIIKKKPVNRRDFLQAAGTILLDGAAVHTLMVLSSCAAAQGSDTPQPLLTPTASSTNTPEATPFPTNTATPSPEPTITPTPTFSIPTIDSVPTEYVGKIDRIEKLSDGRIVAIAKAANEGEPDVKRVLQYDRDKKEWETFVPDHWNSPKVMAQVQEKMDQYPEFFKHVTEYPIENDDPIDISDPTLSNRLQGFQFTDGVPEGSMGIYRNVFGLLITTVQVEQDIPGMGKVRALVGMTKVEGKDGSLLDVPVLLGWKDTQGNFSSVMIHQQIDPLGAVSDELATYDETRAYFDEITRGDQFIVLHHSVGTVEDKNGELEIESMINIILGFANSPNRDFLFSASVMEKMLRKYFKSGNYNLKIGVTEYPKDLYEKFSNNLISEYALLLPFGFVNRIIVNGRIQIPDSDRGK